MELKEKKERLGLIRKIYARMVSKGKVKTRQDQPLLRDEGQTHEDMVAELDESMLPDMGEHLPSCSRRRPAPSADEYISKTRTAAEGRRSDDLSQD